MPPKKPPNHGNNHTEEGAELIAGAFLGLLDTIVRVSLERVEAARFAQGSGPGLLTRQQAADYLAVGLTTLDRLRTTGKIKSLMIGATPRYPRKELDRFIQSEQA